MFFSIGFLVNEHQGQLLSELSSANETEPIKPTNEPSSLEQLSEAAMLVPSAAKIERVPKSEEDKATFDDRILNQEQILPIMDVKDMKPEEVSADIDKASAADALDELTLSSEENIVNIGRQSLEDENSNDRMTSAFEALQQVIFGFCGKR